MLSLFALNLLFCFSGCFGNEVAILEDHVYLAESNGKAVQLVWTTSLVRVCYVEDQFEIWEPKISGKFENFKIVGQQTNQTLGSSMLIMKNVYGDGILPPLLGWRIWRNQFSTLEFVFYRLICPDGYHPLSNFANAKSKKDWQNEYACVHKNFLKVANIGPKYWDSSKVQIGRNEVDLWSIKPINVTRTNITIFDQFNNIINTTSSNLDDFITNFYAASHNGNVSTTFHILDLRNLSTVMLPQATTSALISHRSSSGLIKETTETVKDTRQTTMESIKSRRFAYDPPMHCQSCYPRHSDCGSRWVDDRLQCSCRPGHWYHNHKCKGVGPFVIARTSTLVNSANLKDMVDKYEQLGTEVRHLYAGVSKTSSWEHGDINVVSVPMKENVSRDGLYYNKEIQLQNGLLGNYDVTEIEWHTSDVAPEDGTLVLIESSFDITKFGQNVELENQEIATQNFYLLNSSWLDVTLINHVTDHALPVTNVVISYDVSRDFTLQKIENDIKKDHRNRYGFFLHSEFKTQGYHYRCVYRDTKRHVWSDFGCLTVSPQSKDKVTCKCNHTTIFSVILSMEFIKISYQLQKFTIVCESLSVISLIATIVILFLVRQSLHSDRTIAQIILSFSTLSLHLFSLGSTAATISTVACEIVAVSMHFCLVSVTCWMFVEAVILYLKTAPTRLNIAPYQDSKSRLYRILYTFAFLFPLLLVGISAATGFIYGVYMDYSSSYIDLTERKQLVYSEEATNNLTGKTQDDFGNFESVKKYDRCWLSVSSNMVLYAAVIPIALILTVNFCILIRTTLLIWKLRNESRAYKLSVKYRSEQRRLSIMNMAATARALLLLLPILGIPWAAAFMVNSGQHAEIFMYINAGLNGSQGVFMLIIYCLAKKDVINALRRRCRRN